MEGEKKREGKRGRDGRFFLHKTLFSRLPLSLAFEPRCPPDSRLLRSFLNGGSSGIDGSHSIYNRASVRTAQLLT